MLYSQLSTPIHKPPVLILLDNIREMLTKTHQNVRDIFEKFIRREMEQVLCKEDLVNATFKFDERELAFSNDDSLSIKVSHETIL